MYKLKSENEEGLRTYVNEETGTEIQTKILKVDEAGRKWYGFVDLLNIPFMRRHISEQMRKMYGEPVNESDMRNLISRLKEMLRSADTEKYERVYAEVLHFEDLLNAGRDTIAYFTTLASLYILSADEDISTYNTTQANKKMMYWADFPDLHTFFLNWLNDTNGMLLAHYNATLAAASQMEEAKNQ